MAHGVASASMAAIVVVSVAEILAQISAPTIPGVDIEHVSLEGVLVAAVVVLWRALTAKDVQITESAKAVTAALTASASSNAELRKIIEDSVTSKNHLTESLELLRARLDRAPECGNYSPTTHSSRHD